MYLRLIGNPVEIYTCLEPLYQDYRRIKFKLKTGKYMQRHIDEFVDDLLIKDSVCDITLPRLTKRRVLEENNELVKRVSLLEKELE